MAALDANLSPTPNSTNNAGATPSFNVTLTTGAAASANTRVVVLISYWTGATSGGLLTGVSDPGGSYTKDLGVVHTNGQDRFEVWSRPVTGGLASSTVITAAFSTSLSGTGVGGVLIGAASISGVDMTVGGGVHVTATSNAQSGTGWASGTASPTASGFAIGGAGNEAALSASSTPSAGTELHDLWNASAQQGFATGYSVVSGAGSVNLAGTFTNTSTATTGGIVVYLTDGAVVGPSFVAAGTAAASATNAASISPGIPAGMAAGDIMILVSQIGSNTALADPAGWTPIVSLTGNNSTVMRTQTYYRRWVSGDTAPAIANGGTVVRIARIYGFRNVVPAGDPTDRVSRLANTASATISTTSVSTTVPYTLACFFAGYEDDPTTVSNPSGYTAGPAPATSALGNGIMTALVGYKSLAGTSTENPSTTVSGGTFANSANDGLMLVLRSPASGPFGRGAVIMSSAVFQAALR